MLFFRQPCHGRRNRTTAFRHGLFCGL